MAQTRQSRAFEEHSAAMPSFARLFPRSISLRFLVATLIPVVVALGGLWLFGGLWNLRDPNNAPLAWLGAWIVGIASALMVGGWMAWSFVSPLDSISDAARQLAEGNTKVRVRAFRDLRFLNLARAINRLAEQASSKDGFEHVETLRFQAMLNAMTEAVIALDRSGKIVLINDAAKLLLKGQAEGRTVLEVIRNGGLHDAVNAGLRGKSSRVSFEYETMSRDRRHLIAHVAPLAEDQGALVVFHDMTEQDRTEAMRRDFVANASHELRTPLTAVRGFAEMLRDGEVRDPAVAAKFAQNIVDHAGRLQRIVEDLLELSRAESPEVNFDLEAIPLEALVQRTLRALAPIAEDKGINLSYDVQPHSLEAWGNAPALEQILVNLIENAIKYSKPANPKTPSTNADGEVHVAAALSGPSIVISVKDNGPGIPKAHLNRIFERFYRVDPGRSRNQGGTGLGLSIVRHLASRMRGSVTVESEENRGSVFSLVLKSKQTSSTASSELDARIEVEAQR